MGHDTETNVLGRVLVRLWVRQWLHDSVFNTAVAVSDGRDAGRWLKRAIAVHFKKRVIAMGKLKVWLDSKGNAFHDSCFDSGESKEGYEEADLNNLDADAECEACSAPIFAQPDDDDDDTDDDDDSDDAA